MIEPLILQRLEEFRRVREESDEDDIFRELAFCLFTPQSKARSCWSAVENLASNELLYRGSAREIAGVINTVRFRNNKARYLVEAREMFSIVRGPFTGEPIARGSPGPGKVISIGSRLAKFADSRDMREWLVKEVKGLGYKEASHFLRNIGMGEELAILDRHILKNLATAGAIDGVPTSVTRKRYMDIEERMREFSKIIGIPMAHLDLVLWYMETGEVFK